MKRPALPVLVALVLGALALPHGCGGGCREEDRTLLTAAVPAAAADLLDGPAAPTPGPTGAAEPASLSALVPGRAPAAADGVFVIRSPKALVDDTGLRAALSGDVGRMLMTAVEDELGFSPLDFEGLRAAGLSPDAPALMITQGESFVLLHVAATDPAKTIGLIRQWGADNAVPLEEVTLDAEAGGGAGLRLTVPGAGETTLLAGEGAFVLAYREGDAPTVRDALADARSQAETWRGRLAAFAGHEPPGSLLVAWSEPTTEAEAQELFGVEDAPSPLMKGFLDGMTGAATFYQEADNFTALALEGNGVRLTVRDRVLDLESSRHWLSAAVGVRDALALVPDEPIALVMETIRKEDIAFWIDFVAGMQPGFGESVAAFGRAWREAGLDAAVWGAQPTQLRLLGYSFWGPDDSDAGMDVALFVELGDDARLVRGLAERLFEELGRAGGLPEPARSTWEDVPVWYLARRPDPDAAVCTTLDRLLVCAASAVRLKRVIARHRQEAGTAPRAQDLVAYWHADPQRFLASFPLRQLGIPPALRGALDQVAGAVGPITFVERLDEAGASMTARVQGRERPLLGAALEIGLGLAGLLGP